MGDESQIQITGHFDVTPDRLARLETELSRHLALSRSDPGCLKFDVWPSATVPGRFCVDELFDSETAFVNHVERVKQSDWWSFSEGFSRDYAIDKIERQ